MEQVLYIYTLLQKLCPQNTGFLRDRRSRGVCDIYADNDRSLRETLLANYNCLPLLTMFLSIVTSTNYLLQQSTT